MEIKFEIKSNRILNDIKFYLKDINIEINKLYNKRHLLEKKLAQKIEEYSKTELYYKHVLEIGVNKKIKKLNIIKNILKEYNEINKEISYLSKERDKFILEIKKTNKQY